MINGAQYNKLFVALILLAGLVLPSVLLYALPVSQRLWGFSLLVILIFYYLLSRRTMPNNMMFLVLSGITLSTVTSIYWQNITILAYSGYFLMSALLIGMATAAEIRRAIEIATDILIVMALLAWVSFVYALRGGAPGYEIAGYPGQPVSLYLTSMALSVHGQGVGTFLRPSGIFDEPGAFAFFISLCGACRMLFDMERGKTWFLILAGMVTTSLALVAFVAVIGIGELFTKRPRRTLARRFSLLLPLLIAVGFISVLINFWSEISLIFAVLMERLAPGTDGRLLQGDSRTVQFLSAFEQITPAIAMFGFDASCFGDAATCYAIDIQGGGSPLHPMMMRGLLSQSLYYVVLVIFLYRSLTGRHRLVFLAVALVFMQRPYILAMGYSVWAVMVLLIPYKLRLEEKRQQYRLPLHIPVGSV